MHNHQLLITANPSIAINAVGAGTGDTQVGNQIALPPQYDGLMVLIQLGTITATGVATLRLRGTNTSNTYSAVGTVNCLTDVDAGTVLAAVGTNGTGNDSNTLLALDVYKPGTAGFTYLRAEIQRQTANVVLAGGVYVPYNSKINGTTLTGVATNGATPGSAMTSNPGASAT